MPELPEVETVRRGLTNLVIGKTVLSVWSDNEKSFPNAAHDVEAFLVGATIQEVRRRAKVLLIDLSTDYTLVVHLKMTGQLVYRGDTVFGAGHPSDSLVGALPDRSTRVTFKFSDGSHLYFNDQRKFGWVRLIPTVEVENIDFMRKVGPEPLSDEFTEKVFRERLMKRPKSPIKAVLLDQTVIAGIGNIYADETLFAASIHPMQKVQEVPSAKVKILYGAIREILALSIAQGGSTDKNYVDAEGRKGNYLAFAQVFRKQGTPCPRCGNEIIKIRAAGRGTHLCPHCQNHQHFGAVQ